MVSLYPVSWLRNSGQSHYQDLFAHTVIKELVTLSSKGVWYRTGTKGRKIIDRWVLLRAIRKQGFKYSPTYIMIERVR